MPQMVFRNMDCLEAMRECPDDFFDLAIVDPPYGSGFTEGGGCKGWFTKYHQPPAERASITASEARTAVLKSTSEPQKNGNKRSARYTERSMAGELEKTIGEIRPTHKAKKS